MLMKINVLNALIAGITNLNQTTAVCGLYQFSLVKCINWRNTQHSN